MPGIPEDPDQQNVDTVADHIELPFPPVTREHILHCSYHYWHPKYRTITPKARLVPLTQPFLDYLRADGIILPSDDDERQPQWSDTDSGVFSASDNADAADDSDDESEDVAAGWRNVHNAIKSTIAELGGKAVPKLNWSAPKDATWMNANTMECRTPNDVYLLLKSSDFVTHDLEHAFDDTESSSTITPDSIPYTLALRKAIPRWNPSVEFRCFVRNRRLLCISQRDLNHYDFLSRMAPRLRSLIQEFFDVRLRDTFPDDNYVFDVYVPPPHDRVWLVDFNPWAPRTDPLLFSWTELLDMPEPPSYDDDDDDMEAGFVRLSFRPAAIEGNPILSNDENHDATATDLSRSDSESDSADEELWLPELRLVHAADRVAFGMNAPQYSAHKLPKDVVDASQSGEGLREFARDWQEILAKRQREEKIADSGSEDDG